MNHVLIQQRSNSYPRRHASSTVATAVEPVTGDAVQQLRPAFALTTRMTWIVTLLATAAFLSSCYLAWVSLSSSKILGCDGGVFDCGHVLTSRWSSVLGIPVGIPAALVYAIILGAVAYSRLPNERVRLRALQTVWLLSMTAAFAALWFVALQVTLIGRLCPYCLAVHGCGITLAALMIWKVPLGLKNSIRLASAALVMVGGMVATQLLSAEPQTYVIEDHSAPAAASQLGGGDDAVRSPDVFDAPDLFEAPNLLEGDEASSSSKSAEPPASNLLTPAAQSRSATAGNRSLLSLMQFNSAAQFAGLLLAPQEPAEGEIAEATPTSDPPRRLVPVLGGSKMLDANQWPVWGNPGADHIVVEMFDYTCSHCRNTHKAIREASVQLQGNFAVLALPVPLHRACNDAATSSSPERAHACEIARIAVAVWLSDRSKFTAFHDWLFERERGLAETRAYAEQLIGKESLQAQLAKSTASAYISRNVELYKQAGSGAVPKIILPTKTIVGEVASGQTIVSMVRQ